MDVADRANDWLNTVAAPAIRSGIATVARLRLDLDNFAQWPDAWQEAFQDAVIKVWQSPMARRLAAERQEDDLRRYAYRAGSNTAIGILRYVSAAKRHLGAHDEEQLTWLPAHPSDLPEQVVLLEERRRELVALLDRVQAVLPELPESTDHPQRTILGLRLHLLAQELRAEPWGPDRPADGHSIADGIPPVAHAQPATTEGPLWMEWVRLLLGSGARVPPHREMRLDLQIAGILRPAQTTGAQANDDTRRQAAQWVRTEVSRSRRRLRMLYERRYGVPLDW